MNLKTFSLIVLHEVFGTAEQILFKKSADRLHGHQLKGIRGYLSFFKKILLTPAIFLGFLMTVTAWFVWIIVLASLELSIAVPVNSIHYIMILAVSYFFLKERMHWTRVFGTLLVLVGIIIVALT